MKRKMTKDLEEILLFRTADGKIKIDVLTKEETLWLSLNKIADLFGTSKQNVSYHLQNVYAEGELDKGATIKEILTVQQEGERKVNRLLEYYNLDAIISVGYRINSQKVTFFRICSPM